MFKEVFDEYTSSFDRTNINIDLKYNHSNRVRDLSVKYAKLLNFSEEDILLADFIGQYHDIGRFTQLKLYNTYNDDKSIDHAVEGIRVLFEEGLINRFSFKEEEKEIIKFAILNHNKKEIDKTDNKRMQMHAKLIRDTDKIDIVYLFGILKVLDMKVENEVVPREVVDIFKNHEVVKKNTIEHNEDVLIYLAYPFDINYNPCLNEIMEYEEGFFNIVNKYNNFNEIYNYVLDYVKSRVN